MWKIVIFSVLCCYVLASFHHERYKELREEFKKKKMHWKHQTYEQFRNKSHDALKYMHGAKMKDHKQEAAAETEEDQTEAESAEIPQNFDARKKWPHCKSISEIRNQGSCGSCWAVSSSSVMSDRTCIATKGVKQPYVSDEYVATCCHSCGEGCDGGNPVAAFSFWGEGIPNGGPYGAKNVCQPYRLPCSTCSHQTSKCEKDRCVGSFSGTFAETVTHGRNAHLIRGVRRAQREIIKDGPIDAAFSVYEDFYYYRSGVYHHVSGGYEGGHAVRIIGWGVEDGHKYWLITNSWGPWWGENGLFKILRGVNECGIEGYLNAGEYKS